MTNCEFCGVFSRNACSLYAGYALSRELRNCPNLPSESDRRDALWRAGVLTERDQAVDELREAAERLLASPDEAALRERLREALRGL